MVARLHRVQGQAVKPLLLDLYCSAGGAGMGYARAGFHVVGVDIECQPHYPFQLEFWRADALDALTHGVPAYGLADFDAIHASPPCQAHTTMSNRWRGAGGKADSHVDLIAATRELLIATGLPYVIENVVGARAHMRNPITLHGGMFGLGVHRPRLFESNMLILVPKAPAVADPVGVYGKTHDGRRLFDRGDGSIQFAASSVAQAGAAMGIDWMDWRELCEAIPPSYTEFVGAQLLEHLRAIA